jgi:hypothetical protein
MGYIKAVPMAHKQRRTLPWRRERDGGMEYRVP